MPGTINQYQSNILLDTRLVIRVLKRTRVFVARHPDRSPMTAAGPVFDALYSMHANLNAAINPSYNYTTVGKMAGIFKEWERWYNEQIHSYQGLAIPALLTLGALEVATDELEKIGGRSSTVQRRKVFGRNLSIACDIAANCIYHSMVYHADDDDKVSDKHALAVMDMAILIVQMQYRSFHNLNALKGKPFTAKLLKEKFSPQIAHADNRLESLAQEHDIGEVHDIPRRKITIRNVRQRKAGSRRVNKSRRAN